MVHTISFFPPLSPHTKNTTEPAREKARLSLEQKGDCSKKARFFPFGRACLMILKRKLIFCLQKARTQGNRSA